MSGNGFQMSYANEKPPSTGSADADISSDPASSGFFTTDFKRHEDLKSMLDSNKDSNKLEAMKRIIGMVAKGKDASDLFPAVVKNVVSKNLEVKKLVYVYLTRYAEEQQDLALLSISTFQRALKDPNQLIRASALRVLSSIRVPVITPIMMLAIKESVMDMSPYVRKTAAHAIPKLYSLDPETKEQLIEVLERLLGDKTTLVAGSAIQAFEEVCPERIDLIHKNFRKLCNLLVDVEEWGQVVIINMLTRYCRTQFLNPNQEEGMEVSDKPFYEDSDKEEAEESPEVDGKKKTYMMDPDHRLLLRQSKPLLNSRNAAVVMAVAQLYYHGAPRAEIGIVAKSLVRLLRSHREIQYVVLSNIATMTMKKKGMFEPFLKSFYVRSSDPLHTKLLKLEILTSLATETNISTILRELQTYVTSPDREFAAATIQAIGRCASNISEITDACLNGLVHLMSNRDETVVAESVVVIKKLLQMRPSEHKEIITHMAKMVEKITVPMARASILWLIGEYSERVPKIAPDVLRKMAKNFTNEEDIVKLQILNLAAKLCITNPKQTRLLCQYVLNLTKYDQNYDIRDRSRFLRQLVLPTEGSSVFTKYAKKIFLAMKPAPLLQSNFHDRDNFQLGTLSHILNTRAHGYQELPEWPSVAPDSSVRNVEVTMPWTSERTTSSKKKFEPRSFYSDESSPEDESDEDSEDSSSEEEDSEKSSDEEESEESDSGKKHGGAKVSSEEEEEESEDESESEEDSSDESDDSNSSEDSEEEEDIKAKSKKPARQAVPPNTLPTQTKKDTDFLLDLNDVASPSRGSVPVTPFDLLTPTAAGISSSQAEGRQSPAVAMIMPPVLVPGKFFEILNKIKGNGLSASYKFTRTISVFSPKMVSLELMLSNAGDNLIASIKMGNKKHQPGIEIQDFPEIANLGAGSSTSVLFAINFNDTTQPATFDLVTPTQAFTVSITAPVGELMQPLTLSESDFLAQQGKLSGMNETSVSADIDPSNSSPRGVCTCVHSTANVLQVPSSSDGMFYFAAKTLGTGTLVLVTVKVMDKVAKVTVNCEKMVIGTMLAKDIKVSLGRKN